MLRGCGKLVWSKANSFWQGRRVGRTTRWSCMPAEVSKLYLVGMAELLVISRLGSGLIRSVCFDDESGSSALVGLEKQDTVD